MAVRRVLIGQDVDGNSVVLADAVVEAAAVDDLPDFEPHGLWAADDTAAVPSAQLPAPTTAYFPPVNGGRFQVITFPAGRFHAERRPGQPGDAQHHLRRVHLHRLRKRHPQVGRRP